MPILGVIASSNQQGRAGGLTGAYDALGSIVLSSSAASVTFEAIPTGYKHLEIRVMARSDHPTYGGNDGLLTFNRYDSIQYAIYNNEYMGFAGTGNFSGNQVDQTAINTGIISAAGGSAANIFAVNIIRITDYANPNKYKSVRIMGGLENNSTSGVDLRFTGGSVMMLDPINALTLKTNTGNNFVQYSTFSLYGVK